jgi:hypothetical protein
MPLRPSLRKFILLLLASACSAPLPAKQYAIIKADDFIVQSDQPSRAVSEAYLKFIALVREKKIVASLGISAHVLERATPEYIALCRELDASGRFEIWNHGYDHYYSLTDEHGKFVAAEFYRMPYGYQLRQMKKAQNAVKEKLGIAMRSFGSPGNMNDATTALMLAQFPEIKVWFYAPKDVTLPPDVIAIPRTSLEFNVPQGRVIDVARFIKEYDPAKPVICFQLHPRSKSDADLARIGEAIDFLLSKGVEFIKPHDYYLLTKGATRPQTEAARAGSGTRTD